MKQFSLGARTTLTCIAVAGLAASLPGQSFVFDNGSVNGGPHARIYGPDPGNPNLQQWGNTPDATLPGTQSYPGPGLAGTNYSVQAFFSLQPVSSAYGLLSNAPPVVGLGSLPTFGPSGLFGGFELTIPEAIVNPTNGLGTHYAYLQVRAWDNVGGQVTSWDSAWNAALAGSGRSVGWSKVFYQPLGIGNFSPGLVYFESFNIFIVPEPSTLWLAVLGGASLFAYVRKRGRHKHLG